MRTLLIGLAVAAALTTAGAANAGCMATVGLTPLPDRVAAGGNVDGRHHSVRTDRATATRHPP